MQYLKRSAGFFLALATMIFLFTGTAAAQSAGTGSIVGTITDPGGLVIPGADIVVKNIDTGAERRLVTTEGGLYSAPFLTPGRYEVRVKKSGFAEVIRQNLTLGVGQTLPVDIAMPIKAAQESVTVTTEITGVDTEKMEVSQDINQRAVENLPLNGRRWDNLVLLTPGVSEDGGFGGISFRGISSLYNNNMVDGSDNNQAFFSEARGRTRLPYVYSISAIKEFNVTNAVYSADQGRAAGGTVNAVTKSGTNDLHGEFFYFIRDSIWLARDPIANASGQAKPPERRQQFGGAIGGPIIRDKLFFFANYDQQKRNFPPIYLQNDVNFFNASSVGSAAALCSAAPAAAPAGSAAASVIPAGFATSCTNTLAALLPIFNTTGPRSGDNFVGLAKVDYTWDQNQKISGVVNIQRWNSPNGIQTASVLRLSPLSNGADRVKSEFLTATWTWTMTQSIVSEAKFQYGRDFESQIPNHSGPQIQLTGGADFGMPNFLPRGAFPNEKQFQWQENLSWLKGRHQFKAGFDVRHIRDKIQNLFQGDGIFSYSGNQNVCGPIAGPAPICQTRDSFTRFVLDLTTGSRNYNSFSQAVDPITGDGRGSFSTNDVNLYFQDNWKWRPNLSINAGIRYEVQYMPSVQAGNPLISANQTLNTDTNNFGPRVGFAWSPGGSGKTVIRGGSGVYFGRTQNSTIFVHMFQNGVFQKSFQFNSVLNSVAGVPQSITYPCGSPFAPNTTFLQVSTAPAFSPIFGASGPTPSATFASFAAFQTACPSAGGSVPIVSTMSPKFANPMVYQYDIAYEHEFPWQLIGSVSFVGARGNRLPVFLDENMPAASSTRTYFVLDGASRPTNPVSFTLPFYVLSAATPRPLAASGYPVPLMVAESVVNSWYRGIVVRAKRRLAHGLTFDANYTWSIARDDGQVAGVNGTFTGTISPLDPQNLRGEYGLSDVDIRHRFVANIIWNMPWGNLVDGKELKAILKDWQAASVWHLQDGRPVTALMAGRPTCPTIAGTTADGGLTCGVVSGTGGAINGRVPFFQRNSQITSPGIETFDLRLSRKFRITERMDFEFLWEAFNIFNHTNFVPSGGLLGVNNSMFDFVSSGGTITAASGGNPAIICNTSSAPASALPAGANFGGCLVKREFPRLATTSAFLSPVSTSNVLYGARQMQFGAKIHF